MKHKKSPIPYLTILLFLVVAVPLMDYKSDQKNKIQIDIEFDGKHQLPIQVTGDELVLVSK